MAMPGILYVDAYDSFSNNIIALLTQTTAATITVIKIDSKEPIWETLLARYTAVVVGPGPGNPEKCHDVGLIPSLLDAVAKHGIPVLGICLGFQMLCQSDGVSIANLQVPCHGHAKQILHANVDIFYNVGPVLATCYNSLGVLVSELDVNTASSRSDSLDGSCNSIDIGKPTLTLHKAISHNLLPLAQDSEGYLMAVRHKSLPQWGLQFHPESCKSNRACQHVLKNWWTLVLDWNRSSFPKMRPTPGIVASLPQENAINGITPDIPQSSQAAKVLSSKSRKDAIQDALQYLLTLTQTAGPVLQSRHINSELSTEAIATLCYTTSSRNKIAMLESTRKGRYSIYAMPSSATFSFEQSQGALQICSDGHEDMILGLGIRGCLDLVEQLVSYRQVISSRNTTDNEKSPNATYHSLSSPFWGGFLGYLSYELGLELLDIAQTSTPSMPNIALLWTERSLIVDHSDHTTTIQSIRQDDDAWIRSITRDVTNLERCTLAPRYTANFQEALQSATYVLPDGLDYKAKIAKCLLHLRAGNSYELCLTTEAQVRLPATAQQGFLLYRNLRQHNPVPYAAYMHIANTTLVSSSPEQFLSWGRHGTIDMTPMKGTVRKTPSMTLARASALLASPKEQAENLMIADLIRHDLYAALGPHAQVSVEKLCAVEQHETVYQLVSHIRAHAPLSSPSSPTSAPAEGRRREILHAGHAVLRAALPPGSMTGAPKKRSCEILSSEIEQRARGVYAGVVGYFDLGGGGGWSVCIRSAFSTSSSNLDGTATDREVETDADDADGDKDEEWQTWRVGAGGAVTVLSEAQAEWEEMRTKLQSVLRAFEPDGTT